MPAFYADPLAKLREWASAVRSTHPDVWNDLEDLAQSFEAWRDACGTSAPIDDALEIVRAAPYAKNDSKRPWGYDDTDVVRQAVEITAGVDAALAILGCGTIDDLVAEDVATEIRKAAIKAKGLHALIEEIVTALDLDAPWLEYDSALVAGDLPRFQKWCAAVLASVRRPEAEVIHGQASGLVELANQAEALRAELAQVKEDLHAVRVVASKRALQLETIRKAADEPPGYTGGTANAAAVFLLGLPFDEARNFATLAAEQVGAQFGSAVFAEALAALGFEIRKVTP